MALSTEKTVGLALPTIAAQPHSKTETEQQKADQGSYLLLPAVVTCEHGKAGNLV